jgi:hypothetical protein
MVRSIHSPAHPANGGAGYSPPEAWVDYLDLPAPMMRTGRLDDGDPFEDMVFFSGGRGGGVFYFPLPELISFARLDLYAEQGLARLSPERMLVAPGGERERGGEERDSSRGLRRGESRKRRGWEREKEEVPPPRATWREKKFTTERCRGPHRGIGGAQWSYASYSSHGSRARLIKPCSREMHY